MHPVQFVTRRARNLPLSSLNRPRRPSRWITAARLTAYGLSVAIVAALAWLVTR
jgi:uncharacterized protein YfaQ (DUF2300 family)